MNSYFSKNSIFTLSDEEEDSDEVISLPSYGEGLKNPNKPSYGEGLKNPTELQSGDSSVLDEHRQKEKREDNDKDGSILTESKKRLSSRISFPNYKENHFSSEVVGNDESSTFQLTRVNSKEDCEEVRLREGHKRSSRPTLSVLLYQKSTLSTDVEEKRRSKSAVGIKTFDFKNFESSAMYPKSKSMGDLLSKKKEGFKNENHSKRRSCLKTMTSVFKGKILPVFITPKLSLKSEFIMMEAHGRHIGGIGARKDGTCWVFFRGDNSIIHVDKKGRLLEHISTTMAIDDLGVDAGDNIYVSCPQSKTIKRIDLQGTGAKFADLQGLPRGIAYHAQRDEVIVCLNDSSTRCNNSRDGDGNAVIRFAIKESEDVKAAVDLRLVSYDNCADFHHLTCPVRVSVNNRNGDIVLSDNEQKSLAVFNAKMRFRFKVIGRDIFHPSTTYRHPIVCIDSDGKIFTFCNFSRKGFHNVVVLSADGEEIEKLRVSQLFGRYIHAAQFDSKGHLWVACDNTVLVFSVDI